MPVLWQVVANICLNEFIDKRNQFVGDDRSNETLRAGDLHLTGCYSCLHDVNPNMVPMTFYGMKMLHNLWEAGCRVPPLSDSNGRKGPTLLETMPGAVLQSFNLPRTNSGKAYKKSDTNAKDRRKEILNNLAEKSDVKLPNLAGKFYDECLKNHDCLDSVVAAVAGAIWAMDKTRFRCPRSTVIVAESGARPQRLHRASPGAMAMTELDAARKEGWIYVPRK